MVTPMLKFFCWQLILSIGAGEVMYQGGNSKTVHICMFLGGCEIAVTVRTRCGWVKFVECDELMNEKRFPLKL